MTSLLFLLELFAYKFIQACTRHDMSLKVMSNVCEMLCIITHNTISHTWNWLVNFDYDTNKKRV